MHRGIRAVALLPALGLALVPAGARAATDPGTIAEELRRDPVFVERGARPGLTPAEAGRIRLRIVRRDIGRIRIAVLSRETVEGLGGISEAANAIQRELDARGALVTTAGGSFHAVVSYPSVDQVVAALRSAATRNERRGLVAQLLAVVDAIARVDPGPSAEPSPGRSVPGGADRGDDAADEVLGTFKLAVLLVAAAVALPFVMGALWLLLRMRRRRADEAERLSDVREAAVEELVALGEEIGAFDLDVSMPGADPDAVAVYNSAVGHYERANKALTRRTSESRLATGRAELAEGRRCMDAAKVLLGGSRT